MKKSILTEDMESCYICGRPKECIHHIYEGTGRRKISDKNGFVIPLCNYHHNMSDEGIHFDHEVDLFMKKQCQIRYESLGHTTEEFIELIGRNYK